MAQRARLEQQRFANCGNAVPKHPLPLATQHGQREIHFKILARNNLVDAILDEKIRPSIEIDEYHHDGFGRAMHLELVLTRLVFAPRGFVLREDDIT